MQLMKKKEKKEQKSCAHASERDSVVIGVKQSYRAHQSDRKSRRMEEKVGGRLCAREGRIVTRTLVALVNPLGGGTAPRTTVTTNVLQRWQQLQAVCEATGEAKGLKSAQYEGAATKWV